MDTTGQSVTPGIAAELQRLRRRAYGPDADIAGDPAAQARLAALETTIGRTTPPLRTGDDDADDAEPTPARAASVQAASPRPIEEPALGRRGIDESAPPWWRRRDILALAAALLLICAGILVGMPGALPPVPAETLHIRAESAGVPSAHRAELDAAGSLSHLALVDDGLRLYEDLRGINVWSAPTVHGTTCLLLTTRSQGLWAVACAPSETEPRIELNKYGSVLVHRDEEDPWHGMPFGSLIRVELRGDTVLVWDYPALGPVSLFD
ncbi:hypothetical protein ACPW96_08100 [Micromonospora sp. DT81.3]|uniref:hypothetical protein n=1 Tax=Micromonospora sp. DT81.3 TaxID=3416523 RepID=UPI003CF09727